MSENLRYWDQLCKTDPSQTKKFKRQGGFSGTAIKPVWSQKKLTEVFGPCGIGWGMGEPKFQLVPVMDDIVVYCTLECWYQDGTVSGRVYGVGGDTVTKRRDGNLYVDDEAFKKSYTDALGNAFKHVGASADIHMGMFEDSKYVDAIRKEFDEAEAPATTEKSSAPPSLGSELEAFAAASAGPTSDFLRIAYQKADLGTEVFREWWRSLSDLNKKMLDSIIPELKNRAKYADDKMLPRVDVVKVNGKPNWEATTKALVAEYVQLMTVEECEGFDELNQPIIKMLYEGDRTQYDAYKMVAESHYYALTDRSEVA